jgi:arylsulfatase
MLAALSLVLSTQAAERPNILVILVDDMGFSDLGCYGSEIPTPHLDRLAAGGVRFTQFYNTGRCCPTRASLLTGLYPHQAGVGHMVDDHGRTGYQGRLNDRCATFAEVLRPAGYFTAMVGKWHVGQNLGVVPWERGFDRSLSAAAGGFYFPGHPRAQLFLNGRESDPELPKDWYSTALWTQYGLKFIDEALAAKKPFLLYVAHNAPHFPLQAPAEDIARFRGKYREGWDRLRAARHAKQIELGIVSPAWPLSPRPEAVGAWDSLSDEEKDRFDHLMAVYAAVVSRMDRAVGDLVEGLHQRGALDNTLILFMSDNGGNAEAGPRGRDQGNPSAANSDWFCGESWAHLQNTPFRRYKHFTHEGGIATPLIAHWPAGIPADRNGKLEHQPGHLVDIMATLVDVSGALYPAEVSGHRVQPMEGLSLAPAFRGEPLHRVKPIFWEHEGNCAVRAGPWKAVRKHGEPWELHNLDEDRTEQRNVIGTYKAMGEHLLRQWDDWAAASGVEPWPPGPRQKGEKAGRT